MTRPASFALADKMADPAFPRTDAGLSTLFAQQREDLKAVVEKDVALAAKLGTLARLEAEVETLPETKKVRDLEARLAHLKEVACDTPEIRDTKKELKAARVDQKKVDVVRETKRTVVEAKVLSAASVEARRRMFENLKARHPRTVIETTRAAEALTAGSAAK